METEPRISYQLMGNKKLKAALRREIISRQITPNFINALKNAKKYQTTIMMGVQSIEFARDLPGAIIANHLFDNERTLKQTLRIFLKAIKTVNNKNLRLKGRDDKYALNLCRLFPQRFKYAEDFIKLKSADEALNILEKVKAVELRYVSPTTYIF